jgi:hypothetical protein
MKIDNRFARAAALCHAVNRCSIPSARSWLQLSRGHATERIIVE